MNRGIARRTMFERGDDMRVFLAALACRVRAGELEVHAYCLLGTHYHLLVRSPCGRLAEAMHRIQLAYSRYFNRGRRRDGTLVRGRYRSKPVDTIEYRRALVTYIDENPVLAGLTHRADRYPYCSAYHYRRPDGPIWLTRSWVESEIRAGPSPRGADSRRYAEVFHPASVRTLCRVVEARLRSPRRSDPLVDLVGGAPDRVLDWMRRKAKLADGTAPGLPVTDLETVDSVVARAAREGPWMVGPGPGRCGWSMARVVLSCELGAATREAVASRIGCSDTHVGRLLRLHRKWIDEDAEYGERMAALGAGVLRIWGSGGV